MMGVVDTFVKGRDDVKLTIALSKGRILEETLPLLSSAGITLLEPVKSSRKLILPTNLADVQVLILRAQDVPTFVEQGAADVGVTGKDVLMEHGGRFLYEVLDLGIAACKLMVAEPINYQAHSRNLRIATKYVDITNRYFAEKGAQVDIIKLYGSMELAPLVDLADKIVDVVDTGNTLRANGLQPTELIMKVTSRLIVNKAAMKIKHQAVNDLIQGLSHAMRSNVN